jgi:hypothetical protein
MISQMQAELSARSEIFAEGACYGLQCFGTPIEEADQLEMAAF